jgi:hypothetical protein
MADKRRKSTTPGSEPPAPEAIELILGAPHSGFARLTCRIRSRRSLPIAGRPHRRRLFHDLSRLETPSGRLRQRLRDNRRSA